MNQKFDFEYAGKMYFGKIYRPVAQVSFHSPTQDIWTTTWMIVDTGADFSILPKYISQDLGISLEKDCKVDITQGVGGTEMLPLLGRLGFLETFDTEFLRTKKLIFKG